MENMGDNVALGLPSDVVVRRTVGMKKDEYLLNNKRAELNDVINLFETIGFSRSNPYNIVLQGQVEALAAMSSSERLELVKDIAGASLYDDKKAESLKLLEETQEKMNKVGEVIQSLQDRIDALGEEKDELANYQQLDKKRRALEHRLRDLDLSNVEKQLSELDVEHVALTERSQNTFETSVQLERELEEAEALLRSSAKAKERAETQKKDASVEHSELVRLVGALELDIKDAQSSTQDHSQREQQIDRELAKIGKEIKERQAALEKARKAYDVAMNAETATKEKYDEMDRKAKELYSKQGRIAKFKTKKERDSHLKQEIEKLSTSITHRRKQTSTLESDIVALEASMKQLEMQISSRTRRHDELMESVKEHTGAYQEAKKTRDDMADVRKAQWKEQKELEEKVFQMKSELLHFQRALHSTLSRELVSGLEAISKFETPPKHEVYGPLVDLIDVDEVYMTAVEVTAGNALFHIVVDTDETAAILLTHLNNTRAGRVTCIPLNKVQNKDVVSEINLAGIEAEALPKRVAPKKHVFQPAINQLFGKTLVCSNLELATQLSKEHRVACVTLDGNQVSVKGALTGGFLDERTSRLKTSAKIRELTHSIRVAEQRIVDLAAKSDQLEERITRSIKTMADLERKRNEALYALDTFADTTRAAHRELLGTRDALTKRQHSNMENEAMIKSMQASIAALEEEMSSGLFSKLSEAESDELQTLNVALDRVSQELTAAIEERAGHEAIKSELEALLGGNLLPRQGDLESQKASIAMRPFTAKTAQSADSLQAELQRSRKKLEQARVVEEESDRLLVEERAHYKEQEERIEGLRKELEKAQESVSVRSQQLEKLFNTRATVIAKRDDLLKRIREIGSLPSKESEEVSGYAHSKCQKELAETKERLTRFGNVNKKALDQYLSFSEEKEKFSQRRDQMELEHDAIRNLISKLDLQKDEAIARTFRGVAKNFSKVFAEACPDGEATLVMKVSKSAEEYLSQEQRPDQYVGIDLKVTFNKASGNVIEGGGTKRLSGGQKTITSLSLIFAIQRCDPAPFYIFDEIDPALDDRYRATVAGMIRRQSESMQFIIVTHHPEMVRVAQKNYVISFKNRVSRVEVEDVDTALEVVAAAKKAEDDQMAKHQQGPKKKRRAATSEAVETIATTRAAEGEQEEAEGMGDDAEAEVAGKVTTKKKTSSATKSKSKVGTKEGDDDNDDDELVVRFDRKDKDEEVDPMDLEPEQDVLEPPKRRSKRGRESASFHVHD